MAALLHAGDLSMLGDATAAWWYRILPVEPSRIHLISPKQVRPTAGLVIMRAKLQSVEHRGMPTCPIERVLLDIASSVSAVRLRRAISEALYLRLTTVDRIEASLGPGRAGSAAVRSALVRHKGEVQRSRSEAEEAFFLICERERIPLPLVNQKWAGIEVDFCWPQLRLAVEIDGPGHAQMARMADDRAREMALRAVGIDVIRYTVGQITEDTVIVGAEIRREVARRQPTRGPR